MPEQHPPSRPYARHKIPTLSAFTTDSLFIRIKCTWCKIDHLYRPADLVPLCGDITVYEIAGKFRCERCDKKSYMEAELYSPMAADTVGLKVRKLVEIKLVRKPVWQDVTL